MALTASAEATPGAGAPRWLLDTLVCPRCYGDLNWGETRIVCSDCGSAFDQTHRGTIDLLADEALAEDLSGWEGRLEKTRQYFEDLTRSREETIEAIHCDYDPLAPTLARCRGRVVDVGGGSGIARHYLPPEADYVVVDPMLEWLRPWWRSLADRFPCMAEQAPFVRGVAERLPLADRSFDAALLICTLNHLTRPETAVDEVARVLRPGGTCVAVLEDMEPAWRDLLRGDYPDRNLRQRLETLAEKLVSHLRGWPLSEDHVRIADADFRRWVSPRLTVRGRDWVGLEFKDWRGAYLVYELERAS